MVLDALSDIGIRRPADLLACYLVGGAELDAFLGDAPPHVDDLPAVEYESGTLLAGDWTWLATFSRLLAHRAAAPPADYLVALTPEERARARVRFTLNGQAMAEQRDFLARELRATPE